MAFSRTASREHITYLRRRPRVGETVASPAPDAPPERWILSLTAPAPPKPSLPPARRLQGRLLLTAEVATVTLDRRQSAIGSLAFALVGPGALSAVWELVDGTSGIVDDAQDVRVSPEFGRRPIVQLLNGRVVVGLRHVRKLRRLVVVAGGFQGSEPQRLVAELYSGATVETAVTSVGPPAVAALALYGVDGELVLRREGYGFESTTAVAEAYGFANTWLPPVR